MLLLLLAVPVAILAFLSPATALIILYGLLPTYVIKGSAAGLPINFLEAATFMVGVGFLVRITTNADFRNQVWRRLTWLWTERKGFIVATGLFLAIALLTALLGVDMRRSFGVIKGWYLLPILVGLATFTAFRAKRDVYYTIAALSTSAAFISWFGLMEYFWSIPGKIVNFRLDSIFTSPNYHSMFVGPIIILAIGLILYVKDIRQQRALLWTLMGTTALNVWALYLTLSFGGFLALFAGLGFLLVAMALRASTSRRKTAYIALGIFAVMVASTVFYSLTSFKFQRDFADINNPDSSLHGRLEVWIAAREIIKHHPIVGMGPGNYEEGYVLYLEDALGHEPLQEMMVHAHNIFLDFWTDSGIIGLFSFLILLGYLILLSKRGGMKQDNLLFIGMAALVCVVAHGLVDTPILKNDLAYLFWFIVFMLVMVPALPTGERA